MQPRCKNGPWEPLQNLAQEDPAWEGLTNWCIIHPSSSPQTLPTPSCREQGWSQHHLPTRPRHFCQRSVTFFLHNSKTQITASGPIASWQIDGEKMETMTDFIFLGSKITAASDCSQEIKRRLLLGRKTTTNLDNMLKKRQLFADKGPYSQSYGFPSSHVPM